MKLFRRSLAEDGVDRLNHTWSMALFLLLALITWLLPLSPVYQQQLAPANQQTVPVSQLDDLTTAVKIPEYGAVCFCPNSFTLAMIAYTNAHCANRFNRVLDRNDTGIELHDLALDYPDFQRPEFVFTPNVTRESLRLETEEQKRVIAKELQAEFENAQQEEVEIKESVGYLVSVRTPLTMFLLALGLKIPHLVWMLISACSSLNIDQILRVAIQGHSLDGHGRRELHSDLASIVSTMIKSSPKRASALYLVFKVLAVAVVVAEILIVGVHVLPAIEDQNQQLETLSTPSATVLRSSILEQRFQEDMEKVHKEIDSYRGIILLCDMSIRMISNVQRYTIQCQFTPEDEPQDLQTRIQSTPLVRADAEESQTLIRGSVLLDAHKVMFTAVLALLVILAVTNLSSIAGWLWRVKSSITWLKPGFTLPMDGRFLLAMSHENAGPVVTRELAHAAHWAEGREGPSVSAKLQEDNV